MEDILKGKIYPEIPMSHSSLVFTEYPSTKVAKKDNKQMAKINGEEEQYAEVIPLNQINSINQTKTRENMDILAETASTHLFSTNNTSTDLRKLFGENNLKTENKIFGQDGSNTINESENNFDFLESLPTTGFEEYKVEQNAISQQKTDLPQSMENYETAAKNDYFSNYDELNLGFDIDNNNLETNYLGIDTTKAENADVNNDTEKILSELGILDFQENQNQNLNQKASPQKGLEIAEYPSTKVEDNQEFNINELLNNDTNNNSSYSYEYSYEDFSSTNNNNANNIDTNKNTYTDDNFDIDNYINNMDIDTYINTDNVFNTNINKENLKQTQTNQINYNLVETNLKKESAKPIQSFNVPMTSTSKIESTQKTNVINEEINELNLEEYLTTEKNDLEGVKSAKTKETSTQTDDNHLIIPYNPDENRENDMSTKPQIEIKENIQKENNEFVFETTTTKTSIPVTQNQNQVSTTINYEKTPIENKFVSHTVSILDNINPTQTQIVTEVATPKFENIIPIETHIESQTAQKIENIIPTEIRTSLELDDKPLSKTQYIPTFDTTPLTYIPETKIEETKSIIPTVTTDVQQNIPKTDNTFSYTTTPITVNYSNVSTLENKENLTNTFSFEVPKIETQIPQFTTTSPVIPATTTTTVVQDQIQKQTIIPPIIPTVNNSITIATPIQTIPTINSPVSLNETFIPATNIIPLESQTQVSLTPPTFQSVGPTQFIPLEAEKQSSYIIQPTLSPTLTQITSSETKIAPTPIVPPITNITTTTSNLIPFSSQTQDLFSSKNLSQSYTIFNNNNLSVLPQNQIPISNIPYENRNPNLDIYGLNNNIAFQQNQFGNNNINYYQQQKFSSLPMIQNPNPVPIPMPNQNQIGTQTEIVPVEEIEYVPVKKIKYIQKEKPLTSNMSIPIYNKTPYFQQNPPINYIQNYNQPIVNPNPSLNPNSNVLLYKTNPLPYSTNTEVDNEIEDPAIPLEEREKNNLNYNTSNIPRVGTNNLNYNTYSLPQPRSSFGGINVNSNNIVPRGSFMDNNWANSNYQLKTYKPRSLAKFK